MFLKFYKGAMVELHLTTGISLFGKVIHVDETEVLLCKQLGIQVKSTVSPYSSTRLDETRTADSKNILHISRSVIAYWEYVSIRDAWLQDKLVGKIGETFFGEQIEYEDIPNKYYVNYWGSDGFNYGYTDCADYYYGDIPQTEPMSPSIVQRVDCDGYSLSMTL